MMYARMILISLDLKVKLPMMIDIDNKVTFDLINNCIVGSSTSHVETHQLFICYMK